MKNAITQFFLLLSLIFGTSSCISTSDLSTIQVEILRPSIIDNPEKLDTIAIFKRDSYKSDTVSFTYFSDYKQKNDMAIHYRDLSNACVDALADYLNTEGYFVKVVNYRDSMNYLFTNQDSLINYLEYYKRSGFDACIFLDNFQFSDSQYKEKNYWTSGIKDDYEEFESSTILEKVVVKLNWTVAFRSEYPKFVYNQNDQLFYGNAINPELFGSNEKHKELLRNSSVFLGKSFGAMLIPTWQKSDRTYYHSKNKNMLKAETCFNEANWLKAAELYQKQTKSRNRKIAAKAKYNMALACEMEGNTDAALDWLSHSYLSYWEGNNDHKLICEDYLKVLRVRIQEIERVKKQIR